MSFRDDFGQWDPKAQRPELWSLYNGRIRRGEHVRVFPLSNWTELDVWQYIGQEQLEVPNIYLAHERPVFERDLPYNPLHDQGYASIGCAPCTLPGSGRDGRWAGSDKTECGLHVS